MVALSISVTANFGLTWARWKRFVARIEALGFAGLYRSDHFTLQDVDLDSLELIVSLTYLAAATERVRFGPLVAPLSFRDPVMLARQALALDDLSNGRMVLGLGAGYQEREHWGQWAWADPAAGRALRRYLEWATHDSPRVC